MDPLSVSASVITVLGVVEEMIGYLKDLKYGGEQRQKLLDEVTSLWAVLRHLYDTIPRSPVGLQKLLKTLASDESDSILEQCKTLIHELKIQLQPRTRSEKFVQNLRWSFAKKETQQKIKQLHRFQTTINGALAQATLSISSEIASETHASLSILEEQEAAKIQKWLSPTNFFAQQVAISTDHCPGTGVSLLESVGFLNWLSAPNCMLWCRGAPGAGKTHLATMTVDWLREKFAADNTLILVAYCRSDDLAGQKLENIIGDLIRQTLTDGQIPASLRSLYRNALTRNITPSLQDFFNILDQKLKDHHRTYIVLDALDELADSKDRTKLVDFLRPSSFPANVMVTSRPFEDINRSIVLYNHFCDGCFPNGMRLEDKDVPHELILYRCFGGCDLDFCRNCYDSGCRCENTNHEGKMKREENSFLYEVSATLADLERYIEWRTSCDIAISSLINSRMDLKNELVETVLHRSQAIFLLAKFLMDNVASCLSAKQLKEALQSIPITLTAAYDATIRQIDRQGPQVSRIAHQVLTWILFAKSPLTAEEMEHAMAVKPGSQEFDNDDIIPAHKLVDLCSGLVMIDQNGEVRFAHHTIREYIMAQPAVVGLYPKSHITRKCLTYLLYKEFGNTPCRSLQQLKRRLAAYPFLSYCGWAWARHIDEQTGDSECHQMVQDLFDSENHWRSAIQAWSYTSKVDDSRFAAEQTRTALHYAAYLGVVTVVDRILAKDASLVDATECGGYTPIMVAIGWKHTSFVSKMLECKANINILGDGGAALHRAAAQGASDIVELLLAVPGVDVDQLDKKGYSPLAVAVTCDHADVAVRLLKAGAKLNASEYSRSSALGQVGIDETASLLAVDCAAYGVEESMLERDEIDVNVDNLSPPDSPAESECTTGPEPLIFLAIVQGSLELVRQLLSKGASLSLQSALGTEKELLFTPIGFAAKDNRTDIVDCLLAWGGCQPVTLGTHETPKLDTSPATAVFQLPQNQHASYVNLRCGKEKMTPLHYAAGNRNVEMAKMLLAHGADMTVEDSDNQTALDYALGSRDIPIIALFRAAIPTPLAIRH